MKNLQEEVQTLQSHRDQNTELAEMRDKLKQELEALKTELSSKDKQMEELRKRDEETDANSEHSTQSSVDTRMANLEVEVTKLRDVTDSKDQRIAVLSSELKTKSDFIITMEKQLHDKHKELVTKLTQEHLDEFDGVRDKYSVKCEELEQTRKDLETMTTKLDDLEKSQKVQLDELRRDMDTKRSEDILSLETQHSQKLELLVNEHNDELENLRNTMSLKHTEEIALIKVWNGLVHIESAG